MPERARWKPTFVDHRSGLCVEVLVGTTFSAGVHSGLGGVLIDDREVVVGSQGENWRVVRSEGRSATPPGQTDRKDKTMKPTLGRIVIYRSRTGDYDVPAIITATIETLNPKGVELGHIPPLTSERHVHLTCFTAGKPGLRRGAEDFKVESAHGRSENVAGCYQEWDIPLHDEPNQADPGTCRWPERVG